MFKFLIYDLIVLKIN